MRKKMENLNIFDNGLKDLRAAMDKVAAGSRNYERKKEVNEFYTPDYARYKLVIYFKDGRTRWYYSYDIIKFQGGARCDEHESMVKLLRIVKNNQGNFKTAVLYATTEEIPETSKGIYNVEIAKYNWYGSYISNKYVAFIPGPQDFKLDLIKLKVGPKKIEK
jgi:uroporphyrinogen-III decarboxylase